MTYKTEYQIKSFQETPKNIKLRISAADPVYNIYRSVTQQLDAQRQGNANCKTRSQVRGGGKKPWKQKGTGRARAGSIRSPLWRGGGVIFGPKTRNYQQKINKKEKSLAIGNALYNRRNAMISLSSSLLHIDKPKTRNFLTVLDNLNIQRDLKLLIIMKTKPLNIYLATRNIKNIEIISVDQLNILSIIKAEFILVENETIEIINKKYNE